MIEQRTISHIETPSMRKLVTATAIALMIAAVILALVVLPAEYGIDPLGTGKALGLTDLARASATPAPRSDDAVIVPVLEPSATGDAPMVRGAFIAQPNRYQIDSREMTLAPGVGMEIKYNMKKGAGLIYSWTASATLLFEFHGEPNVKPPGREGTDYYETYELDSKTGKDQAHGTFIAPSAGIHGWFWENKSSREVTLKLVTAGFYDWILENRKNKQTALKPMDAGSGPGHPAIPDEIVH